MPGALAVISASMTGTKAERRKSKSGTSTWAELSKGGEVMITRSVEDPNTVYVAIPGEEDIRHVFYEGQYIGWYMP